MVVFTCQNCGDAVKKPKVDKHITIECKNRRFGNPHLCCVDCLKDFDAQTYVDHTKCVTESERYSAPGFVSKPSSNKNEKKQNLWIENVRSVLNKPNLSHQQRQLLQRMSDLENVPRKKNKFQNFIQNSFKTMRPRPDLIESVFVLLDKEYLATQKQENVHKSDNTSSATKIDDLHLGKTVEEVEKKSCADVKNEVENNIDVKKKKRKRENEDPAAELNENHDAEITVENEDAFEVVKKKKKKKKNRDIDNEETMQMDNQKLDENAVESVDEATLGAGSKQISKKKQKKLKFHAQQEKPVGSSDNTESVQDDLIDEDAQVEERVLEGAVGSYNLMNKEKDGDNIGNEQSVPTGNETLSQNVAELEKDAGDLVNGKHISKKKQKKLKLREQLKESVNIDETTESVPGDPVIEVIRQDENVFESSIGASNLASNNVDGNEENTENLTKKQKKEKKKKQKFEAEMKAIELEGKLSINDEELANDENRKEKKKKKRKLSEKNNDDENDVSVKKTKYNNDIENDVEAHANGCQKFSWDDVVRSLLEKSDGEMSLKKMTKKVVAEYHSCFSDDKSFEQISKKFNKKLIKLPFVKISKERVHLCS